MRRSTLRLLAVFVLALLGAPVAMHVILHDLDREHEAAAEGDHEHPIVSAAAPFVASLTRAALPVVAIPAPLPATWTRMTTARRNVIALGALRTDTDVGLQSLLATFLI